MHLTRRQQELLWKYRGVPLEQMDDLLARIWMSSEKLDSRSTLAKKIGTLMDLLFRNFSLKSPPVGRFEVVEPLIPPT